MQKIQNGSGELFSRRRMPEATRFGRQEFGEGWIEVDVFLVEMHVEVVLARGRRARDVDRIT